VTLRGSADTRGRFAAPRVGLFGILGAGNIGNDASMESVLRYLRAEHPDAIVDALCSGPERLKAEYDIEAIPMMWYQKHDKRLSGVTATALKVLGKGVDAFRTATWVRRHEVIIVPGMGVLEASLPLRAWGFPYEMFLICAAGRLFGTKVALVSVGADPIGNRAVRWFSTSAARLAFYRSYRDVHSRDTMRQRGVDVTGDRVYPDLVYSPPSPHRDAGDPQTVAVGVMAYRGSNDDRPQADAIYDSYVANVKRFVRWLVDNGRNIRLLIGDANGSDYSVAQEILADLRARLPHLEPGRVVAEPVSTFADVEREMATAGIVVATRYHNVLCGLKLGKPTISLGYSSKHRALMADMGLAEFCQSAKSLDVDLLIKQFTELESRAPQLRQAMAERNLANARQLDRQFSVMSSLLFPAREPAPVEPSSLLLRCQCYARHSWHRADIARPDASRDTRSA
jgi:polysaccharide pyruvyl transferase WcaK-like protein